MELDLERFNDDDLARLYHEAHKAIDDCDKLKEPAQNMIKAIQQILTKRLHDRGSTAINTPHGTIHTVSRTTARIMDPEEFRNYVIRSARWDMLDWKANMSACRNQMEETKKEIPGVELSSFRRLSITAPQVQEQHNDE